MKSKQVRRLLAVAAVGAMCSAPLMAATQASGPEPGSTLRVNAITPDQQQVFSVKAVGPKGKLYPLKAIVHSGKISSVKVMGPNGELLSVRAIAPNGDIYPIKMLNKKVY
jgi:hypothetical protein